MFKSIYIFFFTLFGYLLFLSFSSGPTGSIGDRTGSPLSGGFCNACHDSPGNFTPATTITIADSNNTSISNGLYKPGYNYTLTISVFSPPANNIIPQYGVQSVILTSSNAQAGVLSNPTTGSLGSGTGARIYDLSGRSYLEHTQTSTDGIFNATWTAPPVGTGTITVYAMGQAVNGNLAFTGDNCASGSLLLAEDLTIGINKRKAEELKFNVFPSPVIDDFFYIEGIRGEANIAIYDIAGHKVFQNESKGALNFIPVKLLQPHKGIYFLHIMQGNKTGIKQILIQ